MNHPYSGAASYIYASEHDRDDISETGAYANVNGFFLYPNDRDESTPIHSPSTTQTHLASSFGPSTMSSPASRTRHLSIPSGKRHMRWDTVQGTVPPPSFGRSDGMRSNQVGTHSTWNSPAAVYYEPPPNQALPSFVEFRDHHQRPFQFERKREPARARRWRRTWQRRIYHAFRMLRRLWARDA
ncbi:hypothetical protein GYMLUDRAFT_35849 [Collybiopsis luxurians FD-317 M1]|nr:hypothetical protein GYMLUDRAFT_35849 [Collybiopsis luxurians FD-317 M1]